MHRYNHTTALMELGTLASGSVIFSIANLDTAKVITMKRLKSVQGFSGTAAATAIAFGLLRATGTPAAGTGNAVTSAIGKQDPGSPDSIAEVRWVPAAITGLTPDSVADFKSTLLTHQNANLLADELIVDNQQSPPEDVIKILPGITLCVITRGVAVAGSKIGFDAEWGEK
jgi:hypothetical protein